MTTAATIQDLQATKDALTQELKGVKDAGDALHHVGEQRWQYVYPSIISLEAKISGMIVRMDQMEIRAVGPLTSGSGGKGWQLTRPTDMDPAEFTGKDEEWLRWKESMEDFLDAVHPGLKQVLNIAATTRDQKTDRLQMNVTEDEWNLSHNIFVLLKRETTGEARVMVMCVSRENGFEAWLLLVG